MQHLVGGGLVVVVPRHHVRPARQDFAHRAVAAGGELDLDAVEWLADRPGSHRLVRARDAQHGRRLGQAVSFEQADAEVVEKPGDALGQRGAAADGEPQPSAERGMGLAKEHRADVETPFAVEPAVEIAQPIEQRVEEWPLRLDTVNDAAMNRFPQRGHSDHRGRPHVGQRTREARGVDAERIDHGRAERERQQHPAGEFEGVMQREQREHHVRRSSAKTRASIATSAAKFPCVSITPLGAPVVPEVKTMEASVLRSGAGRASGRPLRTNGRLSSANSSSTMSPFISANALPRRFATSAEHSAAAGVAMRQIGASSSGEIRWSSGTATAPAERIEKYASTHSGEFSPTSSTRSPVLTPRIPSSSPARCALSRSSR